MNIFGQGKFLNVSLRRQLLITFTICIVLLTVASTSLLTKLTRDVVEDRLVDEGLKLTDTFAAQSAVALLYGSEDTALEAAEVIMTFPDILGIEILNTDLSRLGKSGDKFQAIASHEIIPKNNFDDAILVHQDNTKWEFVAPVFTGNVQAPQTPFEEVSITKELIGYVRLSMSKQVLKSMQANILNFNLTISLMLTAIIVTLLMIITANVTQPLRSLANVMQRSKSGEMDIRAEIKGSRDIVEMEVAFNAMMEVLEARETSLSLARDQALESAKIKSEFAANVSHELRTPMNGVLGMLELLDDMGLDKKQLEYVATARNSAESLLSLIDDILDFSKNESGKMILEVSEFSLPNILEEVVSILAPQARKKNIDIAYILHDDISFSFLGDADRLKQVLINLAGNAVKFTKDGDVGIIVSQVDKNDNKAHLKFEVQDTGIGIDSAVQQKIFGAFLQADGSTTRQFGGTGLGLAICKQLVHMMGGDIQLESEISKGSNFHFTIPLLTNPSEQGAPTSKNISSNSIRALVVDDSALNRLLIQQLFGQEDIVSTILGDTESALESFSSAIVNEKPYQLVFVDENLGTTSGQSFIQNLAYLDQKKQSRFVLMTHASRNNENKYSGITISASLNKPLQRSKFYSSINRLLRNEQATPENITRPSSPNIAPKTHTGSVLIVEDNKANQQVALGMLERLGYTTDVAINGIECLQKLEAKRYDLILMDCHMPVMDGYEATREIRNLSSDTSKTTIIAMTANVQKGEADKCLSIGMNDYLSKPLKLTVLDQMLQKWVEQHQATTEEERNQTIESPENKAEIVERNTIATLHAQIGDVMYTMIQTYLEDLPIYLNALTEAIGNTNPKSAADVAHTIKGSSGNFGANRLVDACQRLETLARTGVLEGVESIVEEIKVESDLVHQVLSDEYQMAATPSLQKNTQQQRSRDTKPHILVVDDDRGARFTLTEVLRNEGYFVDEAADGREAIVCCEQSTPDLILMDAIMPEIDGFTACNMIKSLPEGRDIPILIITALNDESSINRAFSSGATDYISKPINFSVLRQRISRLVQASHAERHVKQLAYRDTLTGLPNRIMFNDRFSDILTAAKTSNKKIALMFLDLDRFKLINDSLGHEAGDLLLKYFAERVQGCMRKGDIVARFGGDEFTIVLDNITSQKVVMSIVNKINQQLASPFVFMGKEIYISTSIGISLFPENGQEAGPLLKKADIAMYRAKENSSRFEFYESYMEDFVSQRLDLENDLRGAVERGEFEVFYQPQELLKTGRIHGMEALVRWNHPTRGLVPPLDFIGLAEDTGQILTIGEWVLRTSCKQLKTWIDAGFEPVVIAVNLSAKQLADPNLIYTIRKALKDSQLEAKYLELEITESTIMENPELVMATLHQLKAMNIKLSIDDFGTGYSSLNYLKRFPIDVIKIDRSFTSDITTNKVDADIVKTIIALAHIMGVKVVAEGVETERQKEFLKTESCDIIQGYYLSKPIQADQFAKEFLTKDESTTTKVTPIRRPKPSN